VNCSTFIYIGATIPFDQFNSATLGIDPWRLVVLAIAILCLRRLPALIALHKFVPDIMTFREAVFCGHFGPMGVGAIFIGTLAQQRLPTPNNPPETGLDYLSLSLQPIIYFLVLSR
jgi:NhaP-type Na+/H+ or K+/H+ antiporter